MNEVKSLLNADRISEWSEKLERHHMWWQTERPSGLHRPKKQWRPTSEIVNAYLNVVQGLHDSRYILDVGCADGRRRNHCVRQNYVGIDPLVLNERYEFPFIRGCGELLPFVDEAFDAVICVETLDHVIDPKRVLSEAARVLSPGGSMFLFVSGENPDLEFRASFQVDETSVHLPFATVRLACQSDLLSRFRHTDILECDGYWAACCTGKLGATELATHETSR